MKSVSSRDTNLGIIVEAKQQYTKQLMNIMKPIIYEEIFELYTRSIETCENPNDLLICFQNELKQVPKWNSDVIKEATQKVLDACSYFNDLITAVFLSNVRILTSVKLGSSKKRKVKLVVPTNETFVHKVYVNVSKSIYNDPFTFSNKRYQGNVLRNMNDVFPLIEVSIEDTIRDMLPIQNILESYLGETMDSDTESESEAESQQNDSEADDHAEEPMMSDHDHEKDFPENDRDPDSDHEDPSHEDPSHEDPGPHEEDNDFFAKPREESPMIKDIPLGRRDPFEEPAERPTERPVERPTERPSEFERDRTKRPQTFFDDVEDN
jgi:hypothetical protein